MRTLGLALAVVLLAACGRGEPVSGASASAPFEESPGPAATASADVPASPSPVLDGSARPVPDVLRPADAGTWGLEVDASVPIRLDRDHDWDEPVVEGAAVHVTRTAFESDPGYDEYLVRAVEPGRASVTLRAPDTTATFAFVVE